MRVVGVLVMAVCGIVLLVLMSSPAIGFHLDRIAWGVGLVAGIVAAFASPSVSPQKTKCQYGFVRWCGSVRNRLFVAGGILSFVLAAYLFHWPLLIRFKFSQSALEHVANRIINKELAPEDFSGKGIGLYRICSINVSFEKEIVWFSTRSSETWGDEGFAYSQNVPVGKKYSLPEMWSVFTVDP